MASLIFPWRTPLVTQDSLFRSLSLLYCPIKVLLSCSCLTNCVFRNEFILLQFRIVSSYVLLFYHTCLPSCTKGWRILVPWRDDSWGSSNSAGPFCSSDLPPESPSISMKKHRSALLKTRAAIHFRRITDYLRFTLSSLTSSAEARSARAGCLGLCPALTPLSQDFKL